MTLLTDTSTGDYQSFLASKRLEAKPRGIDPVGEINPLLFPFQRDVVKWALKLGRAAIFADTGLGKTGMQVEFGRHVALHTNLPVLILAPLAVTGQTVREGKKFGVEVTPCRSQSDVKPGVNITNYEMLKHFDPDAFGGIILDESGILKNFMGSTKRAIIEAFKDTQFKLACTATPAPNDHLELGNHAEFLDVMFSNEMISCWFINDTMSAGDYRLKKHAEKDFWRWVCSWAACFTSPADIGYDGSNYVLPPLQFHEHVVDVDVTSQSNGMLFRTPEMNATNIHAEKKLTTTERAEKVREIVAADESGEPWIIWCDTDYEADALVKALPHAVELRGSEPTTAKERKIADFLDGKTRILISKPKILGWGLNFQHCRKMAFVGLSYSYESLYQAIRRSWRYGQTQAVDCHLVMAETEGPIFRTIREKQAAHETMKAEMISAMSESGVGIRYRSNGLAPVENDVARGKGWTLYLGDCCQELAKIPDNSIDLTVSSLPFSNLYIYSDSIADMGNSADHDEFFQHFKYLLPELFRVTVPGRCVAMHCKDLPLYKGRDGAAGLWDFPGAIVRAFEECGWTYHSRVTVWKCPVIEMQRTKNHGLLYKNLRADSSGSRQGMADYIVVFRKWTGEYPFPKPVTHTKEDFPLDQWQDWASPVWMDIQQTDVLNYKIARDGSDERHICPLQLDLIERCIKLWSNPGDTILDPFNGIGSTGDQAIRHGRKYVGVELKRSYFDVATKNLTAAERSLDQALLFA